MAEPLVTDVPVSSTEPFDLKSITPEERQTWRETGELPKPKEEKPKIEEPPSDAEPEEEEAETDSAPEADKQESKPKRSNAETRIRELVAENKRLKAAQEAPKTQAEPSPAKPEVKAPEEPQEPNIDDFDGTKGKTFEDYEKAVRKFNREYAEYVADKKADEKLQAYKREQSQNEAVKRTTDKLVEARTRYANFDEIAKPTIEAFTDPKIHSSVMQALDGAENVADVLYAIGNGKERDEIIKLAQTNPVMAILKIGKYEALVAEALAKPEKSEKKEIPEPVTKLSKPVTEVGGRSTSTKDPAVAAAEAGDVRGTFRAWDRKAAEGSF